ncbi:MAG: ATP synthase F0 subunit C [Deltaproteobacteria bacterium]|nr:ATP synthase F0 subunit C [Deltaproteobacteria bacterium]
MKKVMLGISSAALVTLYSFAALAQEAAAATGSNANDKASWAFMAAGLAIGIAAFGGALGQGRVASAALEGIARNPGAASKLGTPMILGLALIESLVLYAFVIAFLMQGKV